MAAGPRTPPDHETVKREIYVEFIVQGAYVKATAIDGATGLEASVVGLATAARAALSAAAIRKLDYVRKQKGGT